MPAIKLPLPLRKRIAIIHSQLLTVDGVSLEAEKWVKIYKGLGHKPYLVAGKFGSEPKLPYLLIPEMSLEHPTVESIKKMAFEAPLSSEEADALQGLIHSMVSKIKPPLVEFIRKNKINLLSIENVLAIPANIPLGIALSEVIQQLNIPAIMRHHDFFWERSYYIKYNNIPKVLGKNFPPKLSRIEHVTISTSAQQDFLRWTGVDSTVIPNAVDFSFVQKMDEYNSDFRKRFSLKKSDLLFLQPTRIMQRKRIERSIELISELNKKFKKRKAVLLITGPTTPESKDYFEFLVKKARELAVDVVFASDWVYLFRGEKEGMKVYSISDAYANCDAVCFPSDIEGFGNIVIEAAAFKKPLFVNNYPVLREFKARGFEFVEINEKLSREAVDKMYSILSNKRVRALVLEKNFRIVQKHYSLDALESKLEALVESTDAWSLERMVSGAIAFVHNLFAGFLRIFKRK
ncbi:MAG: glycosyltransferase family 4 protein [Candidatus Diapherotrites archaeon]|uniref:Glycosyltransferase family 4 protein n=1 Tax=Candidatus Iainarchaeum sp. TaxID=3101447 RepID=A0A938YWZ4_9ARCH|nr:glycosyltransferase family 4 protein [Candidatus Diapherotrites archaeon]